MEGSNETRILELKKQIGILRWDLDNLRNKETKAMKQMQLKLCQDELEHLTEYLEQESMVPRGAR